MREPDVPAGGISRYPRHSKGQSGHEGDNQAEPPNGYPHSRNLIHRPSSKGEAVSDAPWQSQVRRMGTPSAHSSKCKQHDCNRITTRSV
jgi:hypothetical protein